MKTAHFIKSIRKQLKLTQADFARLIWPDKPAGAGQVAISKYENGIIMPNGETILRVLEIHQGAQGNIPQNI